MALFVTLFMGGFQSVWKYGRFPAFIRAVVFAFVALFTWPLRMSRAWAKGYLDQSVLG